jgi:hypothetical protein
MLISNPGFLVVTYLQTLSERRDDDEKHTEAVSPVKLGLVAILNG